MQIAWLGKSKGSRTLQHSVQNTLARLA